MWNLLWRWRLFACATFVWFVDWCVNYFSININLHELFNHHSFMFCCYVSKLLTPFNLSDQNNDSAWERDHHPIFF